MDDKVATKAPEPKTTAKSEPQAEPEPQAESEPTIADVLRAHQGERHIVVLQDYPDPDAISSAFAHQLISARFDIEVDIVYGGTLSHPQNIALVKLLEIGLLRYEGQFDLTQYAGAVFVDDQGTTADAITTALDEAHVPTVIVVDHHEAQERLKPEFSDIRHVGATASIYAEYLEQGLLKMDKSRREHVVMATALMHGIVTDTSGFVRAAAEDFRAAAFLSEYRDADLLAQVMRQARTKQTMEVIRRALENRVTVESYTIAGIGYLRVEDRDAIAEAADFLLTEENVHTAIIYGILTGADRGESLIGSMRTLRITIDPDQFIKDLVGKDTSGHYFGGGKRTAGGFEIPIGFLSGGREDDFRERKWQVYDAQMKRKILGKIGVGERNP